MQTADLLIRVSTGKQAERGYSQRDQEERLRRFCQIQNITVRDIYVEDFSAKTFNRPQFTKLYIKYKKQKGRPDYLFFTKWSRFIRNMTDGLVMIRSMRSMGIETQAIEQWIDFSVPQSKYMLAFYLAEPEVANDVLSIQVSQGMRKAKKEGRWMGHAPIGYKNVHSADGKRKYIEQDGRNAIIMRWVFESIAAGSFSTESIFKMALSRGLTTFHGHTCSKTNFWRSIKDPVYCGKITVPAYGSEEAQLAAGQHTPLISEALFYQVQDVLAGRKRKRATAGVCDDRFPLRGFIQCEQCGRILTASSSRGKCGGYYDYYHCSGGCRVRFKAGAIHQSFREELSRWKPHIAVKHLYKLVLDDIYTQHTKIRNKELLAVQDEIAALQDRLRQNRKFLLEEKIESDDYKAEKRECEEKIVRLEAQLEDYVFIKPDIGPLVDDALQVLEHVDELYDSGDIEFKRELISSIFPEKLHFDGNRVRTPKVNEAMALMFNLSKVFRVNKEGQLIDLSELSLQVALQGFEP